MELRPWSVCGGAAAPAVAVETDPRAADPAAVDQQFHRICNKKKGSTGFINILYSYYLYLQ